LKNISLKSDVNGRIKLVRCNPYLRLCGDKNTKLERDWRRT
jgi:hypothetical protein